MGVTIKQIAQEVGLSWPAVSQILNQRGRFAVETRKKVLAVAAKHGYRPNSSARALRDQSSKLVGVLFRNDPNNPLTNMSAFEYLLGINQRFQEADLGTLLIRASELLVAGDVVEPRVFRERLVDGVIVVGDMPELLVNRVKALSQRVIWLDGPVWTETCCLRRDEYGAGFKCAQALVRLGYRQITLITRELKRLTHHSHLARAAGAKAAAEAAGVPVKAIHWPEVAGEEEFAALNRELRGDVGLIATSLPTARRIMHGAASLGRLPGYHFGLVCCDDSFDTCTGWNTLSRVAFDRYGMGERAASMMLSLLADPAVPPATVTVESPWHPGSSAWGPR